MPELLAHAMNAWTGCQMLLLTLADTAPMRHVHGCLQAKEGEGTQPLGGKAQAKEGSAATRADTAATEAGTTAAAARGKW
jgi:hypothetical protein